MRSLLPHVRDSGDFLELGRSLVRKPDFYAGTLMVLFGVVAALEGPRYRIGTLMQMGSGFMPTALGIVLIFAGSLTAGTAVGVPLGEDQASSPQRPQWLGWACILAGPLMFIVCGRFGLIPATFACVLVSALGDRTATWKSALVLAAAVAVFGVAVFWYFLQIQMPLFRWDLIETALTDLRYGFGVAVQRVVSLV
jgi:hypothetical protein